VEIRRRQQLVQAVARAVRALEQRLRTQLLQRIEGMSAIRALICKDRQRSEVPKTVPNEQYTSSDWCQTPFLMVSDTNGTIQ
jgi:hypothetical protein